MKQKQFKPLRHAGQSIEEEIDRIANDKILFFVFLSFNYAFTTVIIWYDFINKKAQNPLLWTISTTIIVSITIWQFIKGKKRIAHLRKGLEGEQEVAEHLEWFIRERKYRVLHDIATGQWNIDHVLISPKGIFTIETKSLTKTKKHDGKIHFEGDKVVIDGHENIAHVKQAKAEAYWLSNKLEELTGKKIPTRAVIMYPGWWVDGMSDLRTKGDVWAFKPENLKIYTDKLPDIIHDDDVMLATHTVASLVRA